jgi:transposase
MAQRTLSIVTQCCPREPGIQDGSGVCPITALIWALEIGDVSPFRTIKHATSFCSLRICSALVQAVKLAPRQSHELAIVDDQEKQTGNGNRGHLP